jgi:hypothetical protein
MGIGGVGLTRKGVRKVGDFIKTQQKLQKMPGVPLPPEAKNQVGSHNDSVVLMA